MGVFNTIFDLAVGHPSLGVRFAAILVLTVASVCLVGGTAVIANGLYWHHLHR